MAEFINPENCLVSEYCGVSSIFEYTNHDGQYVPYNCGQAAAATFLTFHKTFQAQADRASAIMSDIEAHYPPDNFGGYLGTSRRRVTRICRAYGHCLQEIRGEAKLRHHLSKNEPVIVMLQMPGRKFLNRITVPTGHWMVAYGFDRDNVFLTNYGYMSWETFRKSWVGIVPRIISMRNIGLVLRDKN